MDANEIYFKKNFKKLHNQKTATLTWAIFATGKELNKRYKKFVDYDTEGDYVLDDNQEYIILYFFGNKLIPFTTIRKRNKENEDKYLHSGNNKFKIVVEEEPLPNHWVPM